MSSDPIAHTPPAPKSVSVDVVADDEAAAASDDASSGASSDDDLPPPPPPYKGDDPVGKALYEVGLKKYDATKATNANLGKTDDPMANLQTLQSELKLTEAINFATNLMMTIHQQCMAAINKLGEAGR